MGMDCYWKLFSTPLHRLNHVEHLRTSLTTKEPARLLRASLLSDEVNILVFF